MRQNRLSLLVVVGNDLNRLAHGKSPYAEFRSGPHTLMPRGLKAATGTCRHSAAISAHLP